jgi:hypothetical protein
MLSRSLIRRNIMLNSVCIPVGNTNSCVSKQKAQVSRRPYFEAVSDVGARVAWASYFGSRVGNYTIFRLCDWTQCATTRADWWRSKRQRTRQLNAVLIASLHPFLRTFIRCVKRRSLIRAAAQLDIGGACDLAFFKVGLAVPVQAASAAFISLFLY